MGEIPVPERYTGRNSQAEAPYIRTQYGLKITFLDLRPGMVRGQDMAWHLARTCRYAGLTRQWYSNAEHCILGMKLCKTHEAKRQFLVHDVGEMVTGDVPSPFKRICPEYKAFCERVQSNFNKMLFGEHDFHPEVDIADKLITATEMKHLRGQPDEDLFVEPLKFFPFQCWPWRTAMTEWLHIFRMYYPEYLY